MQTVIMAGGKGTRVASINSTIPKPMLPIQGVPVLELEIAELRRQGFTDLIITVSHLSHVIMDYFGDGSKTSPVTGQPFGVRITYFEEKEPLGNAGALYRIREQLQGAFLLLNADAVFDIDFNRLVAWHRQKGGLATIFTHPNSHPYDSGIILADDSCCVQRWLTKEDEKPAWYRNRVNAGVHVLERALLDETSEAMAALSKVDLDRQLLRPLAGTGRLYCYDSSEYVKDMGTEERYHAVCEDFRLGRVQAKNLSRKQKAVFLDRDGTINRYVGFLRQLDELELLDGAAKAIRRINELGYLAVVVTNQPVIARGEVTAEQLREIHNKLETLLGREGAYLDAIYYCPHHPHKGFAGEVAALKIDCDCRKPKPGLLLRAAHELNIDLTQSWMVGDRAGDIAAGAAAGCRTALIGSEDAGQDVTVDSLLRFAEDHLDE